jgi:hypothetical protein
MSTLADFEHAKVAITVRNATGAKGSNLTEAEQDARYVNTTGDTMTGNLTVSGDVIAGYVTSQSGATFSGPVFVPAPTLPDHAARLSDVAAASLRAPRPLTGRFVTPCAITALAVGTLAGAAGRVDIAFAPARPYAMAFDQMVVEVTTLIAAALGRIVVYSCDADGWPDALLYESADLDFSTLGAKTGAGFTFAANTPYWVGLHHSSTAAIRAIAVGALTPLDIGVGSGTNTQAGLLRRDSQTYGNGAPNPFGYPTGTGYVAMNQTAPLVRGRMT